MKNYGEFINEGNNVETEGKISDIIWPHYASLNLFDIYLRNKFRSKGLGIPHIKHDSMSYNSKFVNGKVYLAYDIEIGTKTLQEFKGDIPDYFLKIREFFKPFGYVNMEKGDSTTYYFIFLDFDKLISNKDFWIGVMEMHLWRLSKGSKLTKETEVPKYPDWFMKDKNVSNKLKSAQGIAKYDL